MVYLNIEKKIQSLLHSSNETLKCITNGNEEESTLNADLTELFARTSIGF